MAAGDMVMSRDSEKEGPALPIDSEHSGVMQCLKNEEKTGLKRVILTASGGPFLDTPQERLDRVTVKEALEHPNWKMGNKISIDSAT